jgi:hypothetical protein
LFYAIPRPVICAPKDRDQYGRIVALCKIGDPGPDIAHWMVSNGRALDWPQYSSGQYAEAQQRAERASSGMWAGSFVEPWRYRSCIRAGQRPSECLIELWQGLESARQKMSVCPICGLNAGELPKTGDSEGYDCPRHGRFKVSGTVLGSTLSKSVGQWEAALQRAKDRAKVGDLPILTTNDF